MSKQPSFLFKYRLIQMGLNSLFFFLQMFKAFLPSSAIPPSLTVNSERSFISGLFLDAFGKARRPPLPLWPSIPRTL